MVPEPFQWSERYAENSTPWDLGRAHPELEAWLDGLPRLPGTTRGRALVPGCGTAFDAAALARAGWAVTALDVVEGAPLAANRRTIEGAGGQVCITDALTFAPEESFQLVFEHTFFCAIEPDRRADWGELMGRCVEPGGELIALVFPLDRPAELGGPPHGYRTTDLLDALGPGFDVVEDRPAGSPVAARSWAERWLHIRRR